MNPPAKISEAGDFVAVLPCQKEGRVPIFAVLVKRTYALGHNQPAARVEPGRPLQKMDAYYDDGDPETSTGVHVRDCNSDVSDKSERPFILIGRS